MQSTLPTLSMSSPSAIGIVLNIAKRGEEPSQVVAFYKAKTNVITIGRKSTLSKHYNNSGDDKALFRCPVISRRHAKITFSEYGNVYISDLTSHHGTFLLKSVETEPKMLIPEVPNLLSDGDLITFGKSVGRGESFVRPVVARVRLIYAPPTPPSLPSLSAMSTSSSDSAGPNSAAARSTNSGRYGIFRSPSPTAHSAASSSDSESEIEELPPPPAPLAISQPLVGCMVGSVSATARSELLRRILPRIHGIVDMQPTGDVSSNSPIMVSSASPSRSPSVVEISRPAPTELPLRERGFVDAWTAYVESTREPSPAAEDRSSNEPSEQNVESRANSEPVTEVTVEAPVVAATADEHHEGPAQGIVISEAESSTGAVVVAPSGTSNEERPDAEVNDMQVDTQPEAVERVVPDAFDTRMEILKTRLADLEQRVCEDGQDHPTDVSTGARPTVGEVSDATVNAQIVDIHEIKSIVKGAIKEIHDTLITESAKERDILQARLTEAESLLAETKTIALKQAELLSTDKEVTSSAMTLKRKRDDDEDLYQTSSSTAVANANIIHHHGHDLNGACCSGRAHKRRRSMARRIVSGVAKTTAIAAVGAVATWSALAFS